MAAHKTADQIFPLAYWGAFGLSDNSRTIRHRQPACHVFRTSMGRDGGHWTREAADAIESGSKSITDYAVSSNQLADINSPASAPAYFGRYQTFTFECDDPDPQKFREQAPWFAPSDRARPIDRRVGQLFRKCCQRPGFHGVSFVYIASKSFHIHVATDAAPVASNFHTLPPTAIRAGYKAHWWKLSGVVNGVRAKGVGSDARSV